MAAESRSTSEHDLPDADPNVDHFARLGLGRSLSLDREALEDSYLAASKRFHPDRHAGASDRTRRRAMEHTSLINEAYRVLRDPTARAEYMVRLGGIDLDSSESEDNGGAPKPDQAFLMDMLERRERLESVIEAGGEALDRARDEVEGELDEQLDTAAQALTAGDVRGAAFALMVRRYLQRYLDEIENAEERG